jgi:hypothetical protein
MSLLNGIQENSEIAEQRYATAQESRGFSFLSLMPKSGPCYDFTRGGSQVKKSIWLVPHVIKHKENSEVITWRCNWGNVCESKCLYAVGKDKPPEPSQV